jgi:hypothetical protein
MGFKLRHRGNLQWHDMVADFHENLSTDLSVFSGGHTDGQRYNPCSLNMHLYGGER